MDQYKYNRFDYLEILKSEDSQNWMNVIEFQPPEADNNEKLKSKNPDILYETKSEEEVQLKEMKERQEKKKTGLLMGKLHDDMIFLDKGRFKNILLIECSIKRDWVVYMSQTIPLLFIFVFF